MLCTRINEKPTELSIACLEKIITTTDILQSYAFSMASDCGSHYRSWKLVSWSALVATVKYKKDIHLEYGCEHHWKTKVDLGFGVMDSDLEAYTAEKPVDDLSTAVKVWNDCAAARCKANPSVPW